MKKKTLVELFRLAGAPDPESWALSQEKEGIPQLARYLFLRQAWKSVLPDGDTAWIDAYRADARKSPDAPLAGVGHALERLLAAGADRADIAEVARGLQYETMFGMGYLLEDPSIEEPELADMSWRLYQTDEDGDPIEPIGGLHESCLETDPTGREMRPRARRSKR